MNSEPRSNTSDRGTGITTACRRQRRPIKAAVRHSDKQIAEGANLGTVWRIPPAQFKEAAIFAENLILPCTLAGCPAGGTILDPFFGSVTIGRIVGQLIGYVIGTELNESYIQIDPRRLSYKVLALA